jgi:hypothetical protein
MMSELDINYEQFKSLSNAAKLDVLYVNQKRMIDLYEHQVALTASMKRRQGLQWWSLGAITTAITWMFIELWKHVQKV